MYHFSRAFKLFTMIQNKGTTYKELIEFLYGETPPTNHDFLARINPSVVTETIKSNAYDEKVCYEENPNPNATIGFLIEYPFHYYIYKNIYPHLPESEFIVDAIWIRRNVKNWEELIEGFTKFLNVEKVRFRIFHTGLDADEFFKNYQILVSNTNKPILDLPCNQKKKKVRVMYGHSKDLWNFGPWSRVFDLALVYGPYSHKYVRNYTHSVVVGNARFDGWFSGEVDKGIPADLKKRLDPHKKTILYLPTHGNLCSLEFITVAMPELLANYNFIIKPHQLTLYADPERLDKFRQFIIDDPNSERIIWVDDYSDLVGLLAASDVIISDNSGAIFDAVLLDKPIVLIDTLTDQFFEKEMWNIEKRGKDVWDIPLSYPGSIEQQIKHDKQMQVGENVRDAQELSDAIAHALSGIEREAGRRKRIKDLIFSYRDGSSGRRSASAIRSLVKSESREKTFLALQAEMEVSRNTIFLKEMIADLQRVARSYFRVSPLYEERDGLNLVQFSIIVPTFNNCESLEDTLNSLVRQRDIERRSFEIIVVNDGSHDATTEVARKFIRDHPQQKILYLKYPQNKGAGFARNTGILRARGDYIAFTDDDCIVPLDWLVNFQKDFEENPEVVGVGGWHQWHKTANAKKLSIVGKYLAWQVSPMEKLPNKSFRWAETNICGNTSNVCYRKSVLKEVGGFSHYYPAATVEDTELAIRIHKAKFQLLYLPRMVMHKKKYSLHGFVKNNLLRGLANHITSKIHPDYNYLFNISGWNGLFILCRNLIHIFSSKFGAAPLRFPERFLFAGISILMNFCLVIGKYSTAMAVLKKKTQPH
ncbi:MAG: CDP-Glycerol:Poly(Glycerophosphate) glycerophosphotransferase family protein [Parcubacteria group bacterium GW2011_GWD1_44_9]|nr:MAG: CDP-Glycerol:Poly(Glycerophosphate) glycerophosphotransferase family protein [Parcubacteria group bacterium GW2011_GWC1_43_30]KKT86003.1 MAG: CDP-Glycerol:Poly(Glycerophosphate) glycerophosphotransferase family protein [Parcubacteria group bacterium GW2011_GWD1_44_9]